MVSDWFIKEVLIGMDENRIGKGPLYNEIALNIRREIESGRFSERGYLPQERALAEQFSVSRNTVRLALDILQKEKLIRKVQGRGNMLTEREQAGVREFIVLTYGIKTYSQFVLVILQEIEALARLQLAEVVYMNLENDSDGELQNLKNRLSNRKKSVGLLLVGCYSRDTLRKLCGTLDFPMVLIGDIFGSKHRMDEPIVSQVVGNDYTKMYRAVECFLKKDYRRIGIIGEPVTEIWGNAYYQGCIDAFHDQGVPFSDPYFVTTNGYQNLESATRDIIELLTHLFHLNPLPDSLIFPAELTSAVRMFQSFHPDLMSQDFPLIGLSFDGEPHNFPCLAARPEDMIRKAFDILEKENHRHVRVQRREIIESSWLPEKQEKEKNGTHVSITKPIQKEVLAP